MLPGKKMIQVRGGFGFGDFQRGLSVCLPVLALSLHPPRPFYPAQIIINCAPPPFKKQFRSRFSYIPGIYPRVQAVHGALVRYLLETTSRAQETSAAANEAAGAVAGPESTPAAPEGFACDSAELSAELDMRGFVQSLTLDFWLRVFGTECSTWVAKPAAKPVQPKAAHAAGALNGQAAEEGQGQGRGQGQGDGEEGGGAAASDPTGEYEADAELLSKALAAGAGELQVSALDPAVFQIL